MIYDTIIIGTSPLATLEGLYRAQKGERILMIDKSLKLGGAWKSVSLYGIKNIENAIHYLLPSKTAIKFLKENLGLRIKKTENKKTIYKVPFIGNLIFNYNSFLTRLIKIINKKNTSFSDYRNLFLKEKSSLYFKNGTPALIDCISQMILKSNINVMMGVEISKINFNELVTVYSKNGELLKSKKILCSNGSRIQNLYLRGKLIEVKEKIQKRPSVHIIIKDNKVSKINQAIFFNNNLIKYTHDITKYSTVKNENFKIFVVALKHEILENENIYFQIHEVFKKIGICSPNSKIISSKWTNVVLPRLFNEDLEILKKKIGDKFCYLKTESFTHAIDNNYNKWKKIRFNYERE